MPLDPRIALMGQNLDVGKAFNSALMNIQGMNKVKAQEQTALQAKELQKEKSMVNFSFQVGQYLQNGDIEGAMNFTQNRIGTLDANGVDSTDTQEFATVLKSNPEQAKALAGQGVEYGKAKGFFNNNQGQTANQRERDSLLSAISTAIDPSTGQLKPASEMTAMEKAAAIKLRLMPGAVGSSSQTIAGDPSLTESVGDSQASIAGKKEESKLKKGLFFKPLITEAVKKKEIEAKRRGDVFTELNAQEAALPGLEDVVGKLKMLSSDATFTLGGKTYDVVAKEVFGFSTKGAAARDKMISMISNQVLPLLRPIFGSQFTEREGERLIAALADVNSTPTSRRAQLDSFLDQMKRNIETKRLELEGINADNGKAQAQGVTEDDITTTMQIHGMTREEVLAKLGAQ